MYIDSSTAHTLHTTSTQPVQTPSPQDPNDNTPKEKNRFDDKLIMTKEKDQPQTSYKDDPALQQAIAKLQARDSEVRAHEAAHIAAGGGVVTGGASFTYQKGPDGNLYAIGGEVPIDMSTQSTPEATAQKMQKVKTAALAPSNPSPTDIKIASTATMIEQKALQEARELERQEIQEDEKDQNSPAGEASRNSS